MKYSQLIVLLGAASVSGLKLEKNQRSLFDTSLVMLEAGIPVPLAPVAKKIAAKTTTSTVSVKPVVATPAKPLAASTTKSSKIEKSSFVSTKTENEVIVDQTVEVDKRKKKTKKDGPTTLTIV